MKTHMGRDVNGMVKVCVTLHMVEMLGYSTCVRVVTQWFVVSVATLLIVLVAVAFSARCGLYTGCSLPIFFLTIGLARSERRAKP